VAGDPLATDGGQAVDFHVNVDHAVGYACRVVRKVRSAGLTVLVHSRDTARLARLDQALWTFSVLDFLPHVDAGSPLAPQTPVWLSRETAATGRDVLVLLEDEPVPNCREWFPHFDRVIDIVSADEDDLARGRARFRAYRDAGLAPRRHEIAA